MKVIRICAIYTFVMLIISTLISIFNIWDNGLLTMLFGWIGGIIAAILGVFDK